VRACAVCKSIFLDFEDDPGRGEREYLLHLPYCTAKKLFQKKKYKRRLQPIPENEWEEFK